MEKKLADAVNTVKSLEVALEERTKETKASSSDGKKLADAVNTVKSLEVALEEKTKEMKVITSDLKGRIASLAYQLNESKAVGKVSIQRFQFGDLMLFTKNPGSSVYEAVNIRTPNYFLSDDSPLGDIQIGDKVLGNVVVISDAMRAQSSNNKGLPTGAEYHEVTLAKYDMS